MTSTSSAREDRFYSRVPPVGTVLRWRHQGITHVALHVGPTSGGAAAWRTSAGHSDRDLTWEHVRSMIGNNPCSIATLWADVPLLDVVDFGDTAVGAYADQLAGRDPR
jgi:hypothetical protein